VLRLADHLALPINGILGHSFGGKVALSVVERAPLPIATAVIVDSSPSARPNAFAIEDAAAVLVFLEGLPPLRSREHFFELTRARAMSQPTAEWLAMNVRRREGTEELTLRLDLKAIRAMLIDYYNEDLWHVVRDRMRASSVTFILGGRSKHFSDDDKLLLEETVRASAHVQVEGIDGAGHWVHADAPGAFLTAVSSAVRRAGE
jgi:esterase